VHAYLGQSPRDLAQVQACARVRRMLICTDGLSPSMRATRKTFRMPVYAGTRGCSRRRIWPKLLSVRGVKRDEERRIMLGSPAQVEQVRPGMHDPHTRVATIAMAFKHHM
jgi:hypothetical protein